VEREEIPALFYESTASTAKTPNVAAVLLSTD